jgi:hypothetical protein
MAMAMPNHYGCLVQCQLFLVLFDNMDGLTSRMSQQMGRQTRGSKFRCFCLAYTLIRDCGVNLACRMAEVVWCCLRQVHRRHIVRLAMID